MINQYSALEISRYIINKCTSEKKYISNLQLQKILYYIQRYYLKKKNIPLFKEQFQAWQFGPVIPQVYYEYCGSGAMPIFERYEVDIDEDVRKDIDPIIEKKRKMKPWQLVEETHKNGGAWDNVYRQGVGNKCIIPNEFIERYE